MPVRERTCVKQLLSPESQRLSVVLPSKIAAGLASSDRGNAGEEELEDAWHSRADPAASGDFCPSFLAPKLMDGRSFSSQDLSRNSEAMSHALP